MISEHSNDLSGLGGKIIYFLKKLENLFSNNAREETQCVTLIQGGCWAEVGRSPEPCAFTPPLVPLSEAPGPFLRNTDGLKALLSKDQKRVSLQLWSVYFAKINLNLPNLFN